MFDSAPEHLQARQALTDVSNQGVEAFTVVGFNTLAVQDFICPKRLPASLLSLDHFQCGIGRISANGSAMGQPAFNDGIGGGAIQDQARDTCCFSDFGSGIALRTFEVGRVEYDREACTEDDSSQFVKFCVGSSACISVINTCTYCIFRLLITNIFLRTTSERIRIAPNDSTRRMETELLPTADTP